jgi:two-component sensor histidine kinase
MDKAILSRVEKQAWFHKYPRGWPFVLFLLTALGTGLAIVAIERVDRDLEKAELERSMVETASAVKQRFAENVAVLRAGAAFFAASDEVTLEEFHDFARDLHSNQNHFGSMGLGWAPWIAPERISAFEVDQREKGRDTFLVHPRPQIDETGSTPIVYLEPLSRDNRRAIGYDMYSETVRRAAIDKARVTGQPVTSGAIELVQDEENPGSVGFLVYMPVQSGEGANRRTRGFIYSPFRAEEFLDSAAQLFRNRPVEIALYDGSEDVDNLLAQREWSGHSGLSLSTTIDVGDRTWILRISSKADSSLSAISRATLVFGMILALIVMYVGRMITARAAQDRQVLEWLSDQSQIRDSLTRELNHRVKNTLANVLSIVSLTRRRSRDIDDFAERLSARLRALSATHDLLSQSNWANAPLRDIVSSELAPYMAGGDASVAIDGPDIMLAPNDALSLGLAIHELATNAAKYGAFSVPEGKVSVTWRTIGEDVAELHWRESDGPTVSEPGRRGFGMDLIEKVVAHELRSKVDLQFRPEGVECTLQVPVRATKEFALRRYNALMPVRVESG